MTKMYEPQEDSFLLRDVVKEFLKNNKKHFCLDMGTGAGVQGLAMKDFCDRVVCVDVNPEAVSYVSDIVKNDDKFLVVESDLFGNLQNFKNSFDLIVFNPPYLPREEDEVDDPDLTSGVHGLGVTSRFVKDSKKFLSEDGRLFFVVSSLSDVEELNSLLKDEGFLFRIVSRKKFFFEEIMIYEAWLK